MNDRVTDEPGHAEIFSLLPWYANGTLSPEQTWSVSRHLERCSECRDEFRLLAALNESVRAETDLHQRSPADTDAALASVMQRIDAEPASARRPKPWSAWLHGALERVLPRSILSPEIRWGATGLAGLLVAVLGFQLYVGGEGDDFSVLSSPDSVASPLRLSIEAAPGTEPEQLGSIVETLLGDVGRRTVIDAIAGGAITVEFAHGIDVDTLNALVLQLEGDARIERVEVLP